MNPPRFGGAYPHTNYDPSYEEPCTHCGREGGGYRCPKCDLAAEKQEAAFQEWRRTHGYGATRQAFAAGVRYGLEHGGALEALRDVLRWAEPVVESFVGDAGAPSRVIIRNARAVLDAAGREEP